MEQSDQRQSQLIGALTTTAWLAFGGWVLWFFSVVQRASRIGASRFASAWEERIEAVSFISFPPNVPALALSAVAAGVATWLAGPTQDLALAVLLRLIRWAATALVGVAILSAVSILIRETGGPDRLGSIAFRLGGALLAGAVMTFAAAIGRSSPGG